MTPEFAVRVVKVPSSSAESKEMYAVTLAGGTPQTCTCKGFAYRGRCRHLLAAVQQDREGTS